MNNEFLMRRIVYSPDTVKIYCDIPIRILQEVYFKSIINLPMVIFDGEIFSDYLICGDYIEIGIVQWSQFQLNLVEIMSNDYNTLLVKKMFHKLNKLNDKVECCLKKEMLSSNDFKELIDGMAIIDAFAVFNMFIPISKYKKKLKAENARLVLEDIMFCAFEPHRILLRKRKIEMAISLGKGIVIEPMIKDYFDELVYYEEFERWLFFPEKYRSIRFLMRELKGLCKKYLVEELEEELELINKKREESLERARQFAYKICNLNQYLMLPAIVTEEEKRHMIECKLLFCLGKSLEKLDIDIARSDIKIIIKALERYNIYGQ